jgi:DNA-binding MarR family transcriptional regulator
MRRNASNRQRSPDDARVIHLRLSKEGERRLALVFQSHETEREKLGEMPVDLRRCRNGAAASRQT